MRNALLLMVGSTLFAAACGGSPSGTTGSSAGTSASSASSGGISTTGGTSGANGSTGTTTGSPATTTGGTTTGALAAGALCTSNASCTSQVCGIDGTGKCCTAACATTDLTCGATACDDSGSCTYPASTTTCGGEASCSNGTLTGAGNCDGSGSCGAATPTACPGNFACASATACGTTCASSTDCQTGFSCNAGACVPPAAIGACTESDDCLSGVCGLNGTGNCCTVACSTSDATCGATACDATGACVYPAGTACGTDSCAAGTETSNACDATGTCKPSTAACPNGFGCNAADTDCLTTCAGDPDCTTGFFCVLDAGSCAAQQAVGPCTENDACMSGICGLSGTGNCCTVACSTGDATCGAIDCDTKTGVCDYPATTVPCGSVAESCSGSTQQNPSACDGSGTCNTAPGTTDCSPFICDVAACFATCTDNTSCGTGDFCDVVNTTCCAAIAGNALAVDSTNGSDGACCGGATNPCATLTQAMKLIDSAQATGVTITATVAGAGGDWAPKGEVYPIVLGWGVELSAPGVFFNDVAGNSEIFDIANYSANDTVGYASITGTAANNAWIGIDSTMSIQTEDASAIQVEAGNALYIANATVNGNPVPLVLPVLGTTAIAVVAGGSLTVGQDQSAANTGTLSIGGIEIPDGYNGIVCTSANGLGCTITDAALDGGSSLVIQNQEGVDIDAEDFASISLTSAPVIGVAPAAPGFEQCPTKNDAESSGAAIPSAILLNGNVTMTFNNGTVSCISGDGFVLQDTANGSPSLTIDSSTIENTEIAIYANAGTATVTKSFIQYNYNGVEQDSDTVNSTTGTISLGGGGNTVACSSNIESAFGGTNPGISVLNTTDQALDASNTLWDTKTPDLFQCDPTLATCSCESTACTTAAGADGMDAVYESTTANITTTGNALSTLDCTLPAQPGCGNGPPCGPGTQCCLVMGQQVCQADGLNCIVKG